MGMSGKWSEMATAMLHSRAKTEAFRRVLTPEQRDEFDKAVHLLQNEISPAMELVLNTRREWADLIREEFGKYHDHSGGNECGACGAITAANWMDPDYTQDGPPAEPFGIQVVPSRER